MLTRSSLALAIVLTGCSLHPNVSPLVTPTPIAIATPEPTDTPTPTANPTPASELTATLTPTPEAPTPYWDATPTQITPGAIVEVTPLGMGYLWRTPAPKLESIDAVYTPKARQNVRLGPGTTYPVKYRISAGQKVAIVAWISDLPFECWLCLTPECDEAIAMVLDSIFYGALSYE